VDDGGRRREGPSREVLDRIMKVSAKLLGE
jgi:hypothetical protein